MAKKLPGIWTFLLDRFRVTLLLLIGIIVIGTDAWNTIPRETEPTVEIPSMTIVTVWPGATPEDVEKFITDKIEQEVETLDNLDEYTSVSRSGVSVVVVTFDIDTDRTANFQKLRDHINDVEKELPATLPDSPDVQEVSISDVPVLKLVLSGDFAWSELKQFAETMQDEFDTVQKVKDVTVNGAPEDQMHIILDPRALEAQQIGVDQVLAAVRAAHRDMPLGAVIVDGQRIEVTVRGEMDTADEFLAVPITVKNGTVIRLADLGEVRREFDKFEIETYFGTEQSGVNPAVQINVIKSAGTGNVLTMVANIFSKVEELKISGKIPQNLQVEVTYNRADEIVESLDTLTTNGGQTLILIVLIMFVFVGWRESLLAGFAIPLSMMIAVVVMKMTGNTFNGVSLFALVLGVGLLVDNAIVITEGMSEAINEKKLSPREAAIDTLEQFRWPLITGTLTTVFAFLPMLFTISGVSGDYISVIPITVTGMLVAALVVALLLLPSLGVWFFEMIPPVKHKESRTRKKIQEWYGRTMTKILKTAAGTWSVLGVASLALVAAIGLISAGKVPIEIFPSSDFTMFTANFEFPQGTESAETRKLIAPISVELDKFFEPRENGEVWLKNYVFTVGVSQDFQKHGGSTGSGTDEPQLLGLSVQLTDKDARTAKSYEIQPIIQAAVEKVIPAHVDSEFVEVKGGPPSSAPVQIRLLGGEVTHLQTLSEELQKKIEVIPGTVNVRDSSADWVTQLTWQFDRERLAQFGLTPVQVLETLRASVNGVTAVQFSEGDEEIDVDLRIDWEGTREWDDPSTLDFLNRIPLRTPTGNVVTFGQVALSTLSSEVSQIDHLDGQRLVDVLADMKTGIPASTIQKQLDAAVASLALRPGEQVKFGGDSEDGNRLVREMGVAMGIAVLLILVVLVLQFNSFFQPAVTLALIPWSLTGVVFGFAAIGMPISFPTMIGIVALAGILVNDAIVLIDQINRNLSTGMEWHLALVDAGKKRMQPIFITSITTVVGMLPLSLSDEIWGGLGFAIVFGMLFSTVLTLLLVPCMLAAGRYSQNFWRRQGRNVKNYFTS